MDERLRHWHPDREEVAKILDELRPLIRQLALRDQQAIAAEIARRRRRGTVTPASSGAA